MLPFDTNGSFEVPAGVTTLGVDAWGAGGGGSSRGGAAGGGGGGAYAAGQFSSLTGGASVAIVVGTGGGSGQNGGFSSVTAGSAVITANGGRSTTDRNGGAGGSASSISGATTVSFDGGDGGDARQSTSSSNNEAGGGGGGSAFPNADGGNGATGSSSTSSVTAGGIGFGTGGGGAAADGSPTAVAGSIPGAGGGGRGEGGSSGSASGADGQVILSFDCPTYTLSSVVATSSVCTADGTAVVTLNSTASGLPAGKYVITYNRSLPSATGLTANVTVTTAGTASFTVSGLNTAGNALITITNLTSSECSSSISNNNVSNTIVVFGPSVAGTISNPASVCSGTNSTTLSLSGNTGSVQWQSSSDNVSFSNISGANSSSLTITNMTQTTYYRCVVTNGPCSSVNTSSVTLTVIPQPVAGSISGAATVCTGTNSTTLTLTGSTGSRQWQSSTDNVTFTNISGATGTTLNATNLTTTTYYRCVLSNSPCASVNTTAVAVTVTPTSVAGTISGATTVCAGTNSTILTLNGSTGNRQWQSSTDNVNFSNILGATGSTFTATNLTATTYYRCVVTSGVCSAATTPSVTMTVNQPSVAGTISGATTVCAGTNNTVLTLNGSTGNRQWQSSTDNVSFSNISGATGTTFTVTNLTATTYYRCVVTSGVCSAATTPSVTMTVNQPSVAGTISGATTVCAGTNSTVLTLNGSTGSRQWQSSTDNVNFSNISGATGSTFTATNLSETTYYRVVLTNGVCSSATTASVVVTVNQPSVGGTISGATTVCTGSNTTTLTVSGHTGDVQWQESNNGNPPTFTDIANETGSTLTVNNLTTTKYYRCKVTNGACAPAYSNIASIGVSSPSAVGNVSGSTSVCSGSNTTVISMSSATGSIQWQSSTNNSTFTDIAGANTLSITESNLTQTTYYRAVVTNGPCAPAISDVVTVTVVPTSVAGTISGADTVCSGANSTTLTLSGHTGTIQWQQLRNNGSYQNIASASDTDLTVTNLTESATYRAVVTNDICDAVATAPVTITVVESSYAGSISGGGGVCPGSPATLTVEGSRGDIQWQSSEDGVSFTDIAGATGASYTDNNLTAIRYYRVVVTNNNCTPAQSAAVSLEPGVGTTWNGSSWSNGEPTATSPAVIAGNYSQNKDITACVLTITNNAVVSIPSGRNVFLNGALTIQSGSFTLENNAHLYQESDVQNTGNITVKRTTAPLRRLDYILWSAPITGQTLQAFSPLTSTSPSSRYYTYNSETNFYNSIATPGTTQFQNGKGFLIRLPNNHATTPARWTGSFNGVPNNGEVNVALHNGGEGKRYNLVGNPYPSPISIQAFLAENANNITGAMYFWRKTNGASTNAYCTYANGTFVTNGDPTVGSMTQGGNPFGPNKVISVGQGFFVEAKDNANNVKFTNAMRVIDNSNKFLRTVEEQRDRFWINATNAAGAFAQTALVYGGDASTGGDDNNDAKLLSDGAIVFGSIHADSKYAVQGRSTFSVGDIVPLTFKADAAGTYTISIDTAEGRFAEGTMIFLKDNMTGSTINLRKTSYTFASEAGEFNTRFEIRYTRAFLKEIEVPANAVAFVENQTLTVDTGAHKMSKVEVFDLVGRKITETATTLSTVSIPVNMAQQVLVLRITLSTGEVISKKVRS